MIKKLFLGLLAIVVLLVAAQKLQADAVQRDAATKKGLFVDPFLDDKQRDQGLSQSAAIVGGELMLAIDAKFWGVVAMGGAVVLLFFLPWLDYSPVKSIRYRPGWHKVLYGIFFANFVVLGYLGTQAPTDIFNLISQIGTLIYLGFFFLMPVWSRLGTFKTVPDRVTFHAH